MKMKTIQNKDRSSGSMVKLSIVLKKLQPRDVSLKNKNCRVSCAVNYDRSSVPILACIHRFQFEHGKISEYERFRSSLLFQFL